MERGKAEMKRLQGKSEKGTRKRAHMGVDEKMLHVPARHAEHGEAMLTKNFTRRRLTSTRRYILLLYSFTNTVR